MTFTFPWALLDGVPLREGLVSLATRMDRVGTPGEHATRAYAALKVLTILFDRGVPGWDVRVRWSENLAWTFAHEALDLPGFKSLCDVIFNNLSHEVPTHEHDGPRAGGHHRATVRRSRSIHSYR